MRPAASRSPHVLFAVLLVSTAFNLRPAVASIGPVLRELQQALGLSEPAVGVLTAMPLFCFGLVGLLSGRLGRRFGTGTTMIAASTLIAAGLLARAVTPRGSIFLLATFVALVGIAVSNVLLPVAVRSWFPRRVGRMTGVYTTSLMAGTAIGAALTVPVADVLGGWRAGLGVWLVPAIVTLALWPLADRQGGTITAEPASAARTAKSGTAASGTVPDDTPAIPMHRRPRAWALALFLGIQAAEAFTLIGWLPTLLREASGVGPARAGVLLSVTMLVGVPMSMVLSPLTRRFPDQRPLVAGLLVSSAFAYLGLIFAPAAAPTLWVVLAGVGICAYPLALVLIGLRAATDRGTAELSTLVQGVGFLIATLGPLTFGAIHERSGGWVLPLWLLVVLLAPKFVMGMIAGMPGTFDRPGSDAAPFRDRPPDADARPRYP